MSCSFFHQTMDARDCAKSITRSRGQANLFSRSPSFVRRPSILGCLASRALTGRRLPIEIHRHYGQRIHLVWNVNRGCVVSEACLARAFVCSRDFVTFTRHIEHGPLEVMCTCVCEEDPHVFSDKVIHCFSVRPLYAQFFHPEIPWWKVIRFEEILLRAQAPSCCNAQYTEYLVRDMAVLLAYVSDCGCRGGPKPHRTCDTIRRYLSC